MKSEINKIRKERKEDNCSIQLSVEYTTIGRKRKKGEQNKTIQDSTEQCWTGQYNTVQYSTVQYSTVQYSTEQNRTKTVVERRIIRQIDIAMSH